MSPNQFALRDLAAADVQELAALHVAVFTETHAPHGAGPTVALRAQQWKQAFDANSSDVFVVGVSGSDDRLIGCAKGCPHDGGVPGYEGELNKLYLLQQFQRRGLGKRLVAAVAGRFLARGIRSMVLFGDARSAANGFYEAIGAARLYALSGEFRGGYGWTDLEALIARCVKPSNER